MKDWRVPLRPQKKTMDETLQKTSNRKFLIAIGALMAVLIVLLTLSLSSQKEKGVEPPKYASAFLNIDIEAQSAIVLNVKTGKIIFSKNDLSPIPLASLTKLMTVFTAASILKDGATVTVGSNDIKTEGDSGLRIGEKFPLKNLIDFTLVGSSNDAASALASAAKALLPQGVDFSSKMNAVSHDMGLTGFLFENSSGLDCNSVSSGAYGTARDMANLFAHILKTKPELISATRYETITVNSENGLKHRAVNTNEALPYIPGLIGGKTGFTELSQGNLAVVFDPGLGNPYVVVVLGSSEKGRFTDVRKLVSAILSSNKFGEGVK